MKFLDFNNVTSPNVLLRSQKTNVFSSGVAQSVTVSNSNGEIVSSMLTLGTRFFLFCLLKVRHKTYQNTLDQEVQSTQNH